MDGLVQDYSNSSALAIYLLPFPEMARCLFSEKSSPKQVEILSIRYLRTQKYQYVMWVPFHILDQLWHVSTQQATHQNYDITIMWYVV